MPQQMPRCFILHEIALPADFKALLSTLLEKAARNGQNAFGAAVGVSAHRACQRECEDRTKRVHETCEAGVAYSETSTFSCVNKNLIYMRTYHMIG